MTWAPAIPDAAGAGLALRVPAFAAVTVALGIAGHVAAGGALPDLGPIVLLLIAVAVGWRVVARTEQSLPRLLTGVLAVQGGVHLVLADAHDHHAAAMPDMAGAHATGLAADAVPGIAMWAGHALAAVGVAWWLRRGEAATWRAVRRVLPRLLVWAVPAVRGVPARVRPASSPGAVRAVRLRPFVAEPRRGPPAGC